MFPYIPGLKKVTTVMVLGFNLVDILKFLLTTPVQVPRLLICPTYILEALKLQALSPKRPKIKCGSSCCIQTSKRA